MDCWTLPWGYGEKYQGLIWCFPSSISSMFFIRVITSSCCPGTARLPVCRGVEGVCCWAAGVEGWADAAGVAGADGVAAAAAAGDETGGISTAKACVADRGGPSSKFGGSEEVELALERLFRAF